MSVKRFALSKSHIKLLRRVYIDWFDCEYGAPCIDPKRPYGNSDVEQDVCEIMEWKKTDVDEDGEPCYTGKQRAAARKLHKELDTALQIVLFAQSFEPGKYESIDICNQRWSRI